MSFSVQLQVVEYQHLVPSGTQCLIQNLRRGERMEDKWQTPFIIVLGGRVPCRQECWILLLSQKSESQGILGSLFLVPYQSHLALWVEP